MKQFIVDIENLEENPFYKAKIDTYLVRNAIREKIKRKYGYNNPIVNVYYVKKKDRG